jgi:4-hydroxybenzoate polyprenyltransferase
MSTLKILRPLNLVIMAATLFLVRYCIFEPVFRQNQLDGLMPWWQFLLLVAATLLIGAGGYVINDVLDIELDQVNKPGKQVIGKTMKEITGKNLHFNLTAAGLIFGVAFSYLSGNVFLGVLFVIIATALYYYSLKYKYLPAVGNLVVAVLSALVVIIYWIFEFYCLKSQPAAFIEASRYFYQLNRLILAFAAFAFLVSLIREIIKDMQDIAGDTRFGCLTLPIVLGIRNTRIIVISLELTLMGGLAWYQALLHRTGYEAMAYALVLTQLLMLFTLIRTFRAREKKTFGQLSTIMKLVMVTGMLSLTAAWFRNL